jgi:RNA polymerase sigma-70 factor (ECF subfamily)
VGSAEDAEDILQDSLARGLARAGDVRDEESAVAWFYRILRNAVADHWRARAADEHGREAVARETPHAAPEPAVEDEICRCFEALLPTLAPEQAAILRQVDLEGRRPVDVAATTGVTPNTTMVRLHRARRALRERLEQVCRACAAHACLDCTCGDGTPSL